MKILSKNIIGCTVHFKGNKSKNERETIKSISYPDTIWTKESGYALHYFNKTDIYSISRDGVELTTDEILTTPKGFIFGKFECNWADEFDVEGCDVMLQEEFDEWYASSSRNLDKHCKKLTEEEYLARIAYKKDYLENKDPYSFKKKYPEKEIDYDMLLGYEASKCKNYKDYVEKFNDRHSDMGKYRVGFGTNQDLHFSSKEEFWKCFKFVPVSEEFYTTFKSVGSVGEFPINVEY